MKIHILYLGDFDPSGIAIDRHLKHQLNFFGLRDVEFRRIAVTEKQIEKFNLPYKPDKKTEAKLRKDKRTNIGALDRGELKVVELEALTAYAPDQFEELVQSEVDKLFDKKTYETVLKEEEKGKKAISGLVKKKVKFLS